MGKNWLKVLNFNTKMWNYGQINEKACQISGVESKKKIVSRLWQIIKMSLTILFHGAGKTLRAGINISHGNFSNLALCQKGALNY